MVKLKILEVSITLHVENCIFMICDENLMCVICLKCCSKNAWPYFHLLLREQFFTRDDYGEFCNDLLAEFRSSDFITFVIDVFHIGIDNWKNCVTWSILFIFDFYFFFLPQKLSMQCITKVIESTLHSW